MERLWLKKMNANEFGPFFLQLQGQEGEGKKQLKEFF